jgi:hypothetical protein
MLIVWRGFGILVPLMMAGSMLLAMALFGGHTYEQHGWPKLLAFLMAAIAIGWAGSKLNRNRPSGSTHSFFFIDMEVWAIISVIIGVVLAVRS